MAVSARKLGMGSFEGSRIRAIFLHSSTATTAKREISGTKSSSFLRIELKGKCDRFADHLGVDCAKAATSLPNGRALMKK